MTLRTFIAATIGAAALLPGAVHARDWQMDAAHSSLGFSGTYQDSPFKGVFKQFTPVIRFDPVNLADAKFDVEVKTGSADAGDSDKNGTLATPDFFYPAKYPGAHFVAEKFVALGNGKFEAEARLTIRDKTHALKFPFTWTEANGKASLQAKVVIDRIEYDVGGGEWADPGTIAHKIDVAVDLVLLPK
jgi:polyisoprenoid-binding protein YceI